jgi:hypothetical protein
LLLFLGQDSEGKCHEMVSDWRNKFMVEWLPEAEDVHVNAYGMRLASARPWYTIFPFLEATIDLSRLMTLYLMKPLLGTGSVCLTSSS